MHILVLNSGSSSLKFAVVDTDNGENLISGLGDRLGSDGASIRIDRHENGERIRVEEQLNGGAHAEAVARVLAELDSLGMREGVAAVGHRVVHGGEAFNAPAIISDEVKAAIEQCIPLAPLHNPANLAGIDAAKAAFPNLPHVAVFDTAFHQSMAPEAYRYAVPTEWYTKHQVRRYGFHGTSHQYVAAEAVRELGLDPQDHGIVTAHLGNGSSVAAVQNGQSKNTSMGMTPLEGLVMGTRSGNIDAGVLEYMAGQTGQDVKALVNTLNKESGLLGLSGLSNDMRTLEEEVEKGHEGAILAMDAFHHRLAGTIAQHAADLKRWDALVFTGGIGENGDITRADVVKRLGVFGLEIDDDANKATIRGKAGVIGKGPNSLKIIVINTNEELMIARQTAELV